MSSDRPPAPAAPPPPGSRAAPRRRGGALWAALVALGCWPGAARADAGAEEEVHPGIETSYHWVTLRDGTRLRAIATRPAGAARPLRAIHFVQWLSCDPVALPPEGGDGWAAMLRRLVRESGALVWRVEKRGVGGSQGRCDTLDYQTELADHREALEHLLRRPDVDPGRVVIFGGSMGGTYAPLLAAGRPVAGVIVWGAGAWPWVERLLRFERNALELGGTPAGRLGAEMAARYQFLERYLLRGRSPRQIAAEEPRLGAVWRRLVGTSGDLHYGRPARFHQQAQRADWAAAWARVSAPVLVLHGQLDWFEDASSAGLIARIVNGGAPGRATFASLPGLDHHLSEYPSREAAFQERGGRVNADPVVERILAWLAER